MARNTVSIALTVLLFVGCASTATQDPAVRTKASEPLAAVEPELRPEPAVVVPDLVAPAVVEPAAPAAPAPAAPAATSSTQRAPQRAAAPAPVVDAPLVTATPTTSEGSTASEAPAASTEPPAASSEAPVASTEPPAASSEAPTSAPTAAVEPATAAEVLSAVERLPGLSSWTVIPFAQFRRAARHVVVAWLALNSAGSLVDATVVGICLEETADGLAECGRRWVVRDQAAARAATVEALGGSDYEVIGRSAGRELDDLGPEMSRLGTAFAEAVSSGNRSAARQAATSLSRLLPLSTVAYGNDVARLLWAASNHSGRLEHVDTVQTGDTATLTFAVTRSGFRFQTIRATARPVSEGSDRWIVTSYES